MNTLHGRVVIFILIACLVLPVSTEHLAQDASKIRERRVALSPGPFDAKDFALPPGNKVSSPFHKPRIYGPGGQYIGPWTEGYKPRPGEYKNLHSGVDVTSNNSEGKETSFEYKTPVSGKVKLIDSAFNTVRIITRSGREIRFLHSDPIVKDGQDVKAGDVIGRTGGYGQKTIGKDKAGKPIVRKASDAYDIHLHYETIDQTGVRIDPNIWKAELDIEESLIAKGSLKPKSITKTNPASSGSSGRNTNRHNEANLGGIILDKQAEMLSDLSDVYGAFYDPQSERIVFVGARIVDSPTMDKGLLGVALRAVYSGSAPGVSIDPSSDPSVMQVRYLGQTESTRFGSIMFEADRILKALSRGEDNLTRQAVISSVPGYQNIIDRRTSNPNATKGSSLYRLWFKPDKLSLHKTADGHSMTFAESTMTCDWENMQGIDPGPAVQMYVNHLNNNFQAFAEEYPIFGDMLFLEKMVGLALWMRDQNLFLDPNLLGIDSVETPTTTPSTTVTSSINIGDSIWKLVSTGGVDFSIANVYLSDTDRGAARLRESALRERPRLDQVSWDFQLNGEYLTAIALPVVKKSFAPLRLTKKTYISYERGPLILDSHIRQEGDHLIVTFVGQNFGQARGSSQVLLNDRPVTVLSWLNSKVVIKVPASTDGGRFVIVTDGRRSNPITLNVVSRPAMATVRVVNEVNATLYLNVGERRLVIPAYRSEVFVLPAGTYAFTASAGTARDSGIKEFSSGETTWSFSGSVPVPVPEQTPSYSELQNGAEIVIENTGNVALTVTVRGPKSLQLSIAPGTQSIPMRVPLGLYTVQGKHGSFSTEARAYTLGNNTKRLTIQIGVIKTNEIRTPPRRRP